MNLFHNPDTCPICQNIQRFETDAAYAYTPATCCYWGVPGCNCWNEALAYLGPDYEVLTLDLSDLFDDETEDEAESELSRVIGEVRVGNILLPDEGETLLQALVDEEQEHAETLADLGDAEDRIAELEGELAFKNFLLNEAGDALALAANTIVSADGLIDAQRLYIRILEQQVRSLELQAQPRIYVTSLYI